MSDVDEFVASEKLAFWLAASGQPIREGETGDMAVARVTAFIRQAAYEWQRDNAQTDEPPLIDGCRIVKRGDGNYVCKVHARYWAVGSGMCPGRQGR